MTLLKLCGEEVRELPYQIITETRDGVRWDTMTRKRRFAQEFTDHERSMATRVFRTARQWALKTGCPDSVQMSPDLYRLWHKLGRFCATL